MSNAKSSQLLKDSYQYNQAINEQLFSHLDTFEQIPAEVIKLLSHIVNAQSIWLDRIEGSQPSVGVWEIHSWERLKELSREGHQRSLRYLEEKEPGFVIHYQNSKGITYRNSIEEILHHVVNHSTYHRGQIAWVLRENGLEAISTDYIFYKRERLNNISYEK